MQESSSNPWIANQTRKLRFGTNISTKMFIVFFFLILASQQLQFLILVQFLFNWRMRCSCLEKCRKCSRRSFQYVMLSLRLLNVCWFLYVLYIFANKRTKLFSTGQTISYAGLFLLGPQLINSYSRYTSWLNYMSTLSPWRDSKDQDQTPKND